MTGMTVAPPAPETFVKPESRHYANALRSADKIEALTDRYGVTYAWLFPPSRNTWPTWHVNRPAPTPGCGCAPCHRPRCCDTWAEPVVLLTGETVAWVCPTCLEPVIRPGTPTPSTPEEGS